VTPDYPVHPAAAIFPMMGEPELAELAEDIKKNGLLEPVVLHRGAILDGRNRLAACGLAGAEPRFTEWSGESPASYVLSKNLHRRHLTTGQKGAIAAEVMPMLREEARERMREGGREAGRGRPKGSDISTTPISTNETAPPKYDSREIAAKLVGVSSNTVHRAIKVQEADPEVFEQVKSGEVTLAEAHRQVVDNIPPKTKRQEIVENAAKNRMIEALSKVRGLCDSIAGLNVPAITGGCTPKELRTWATMAREEAKVLRAFAALLCSERNGNEESGD
jgi:hypothetical protein